MAETLEERLISARKAAGLTQGQLAERAGLTQGTISKLERGQRDDPGWRKIARIEAALGLRHGELTNGLAA